MSYQGEQPCHSILVPGTLTRVLFFLSSSLCTVCFCDETGLLLLCRSDAWLPVRSDHTPPHYRVQRRPVSVGRAWVATGCVLFRALIVVVKRLNMTVQATSFISAGHAKQAASLEQSLGSSWTPTPPPSHTHSHTHTLTGGHSLVTGLPAGGGLSFCHQL